MKIKIHKIKHPIIQEGFSIGNFFGWDSLWAYHPSIIEYRKRYYLFYTGKRLGRGVKHQIGMAFSKDLKTWEKYHGNPIFIESKKKNVWDNDFVAHSYIFKDGKIYYMFYDGSPKKNWNEAIGIAESTDLVNWKPYDKNPIFDIGTQWWEKRHVSRCCVYKEKDTYYLFYAGHDGKRERIGAAEANSLFNWKRMSQDPVLDIGEKEAWDGKSISDPRIIKYKREYLLFYTGMDQKGIERIGVAISKNLLHFEKYEKNPIMDVSPHSWDAVSAGRADFKIINDQLYCFYSGKKRLFYKIGLAKVTIT